ncbi:MAG: helix-turn-helix transcriptional regulator [Myxococcales bacterium]|nr:helix-turn-helix transcriptional regulator [Myxococcales bacterium]
MELQRLIDDLSVEELTRLDDLIRGRLAALAAPAVPLTARQREIAELVVHGCTNAEIAQMLAISANAVKKHVSRLLELLYASNRTELAGQLARRAA